jgi:hypothetical protein
MPLLRNHSAVFIEKGPSELYSHVDEDEDGHWDQSPLGQDTFSPNSGSAILSKHVSHGGLRSPAKESGAAATGSPFRSSNPVQLLVPCLCMPLHCMDELN